MITPKCHTADWIHTQREHLRATDPLILEKAIFALTLLERLCTTDLEFVFKGGTALLLHLPAPRRLSIDIDITCQLPKLRLEAVFEKMIGQTPFTHWAEHVRGERGLPGRNHYKFHYHSPTQNQDLHILLDVVTEANHLAHLESRPINTSFLEVTEPQMVSTPRLEALLGDKLTAFAPHTVGVPLTARFSQQVIKQLHDIAQLYDHARDLSALAEDNRNSFAAESGYASEFNGSYHDYLDDVINTAYRICALDLRGAPKDRPEEERLLRTGIRQLSSHLIGERFSLPHAKLAAAKAGHLASSLRSGNLPEALPRFKAESIAELKTAQLSEPYQVLNRLKGSLPEVFFHWSHCP